MNLKELLESGEYAIVLDTNVLFGVYRCSPDFTEFSLECLRKVAGFLWLPATVEYEYDKHCRGEFSKMERRVRDAPDSTRSAIENAKRKILGTCDVLRRLHYPNVDVLQNKLEKNLDETQTYVEDFFKQKLALELTAHAWAGEDHLAQLVASIKNEGRIMPTLTQQEIFSWCEEGTKRFKRQTPPGFKDAKNKDGINMYSDLIIWMEVMRFAKDKGKDIIFVTDDVKEDWWEVDEGGKRVFHSKLVSEFEKTGRSIIPLTSQEFFTEISAAYGIEKTDVVEVALRMTDEDYCAAVADDAFNEISYELSYNALEYMDVTSTHIGTEGVEEFEVESYEYVGSQRITRSERTAVYKLTYLVTLIGTSHNYWGRDDDTREVIKSPDIEHTFEGEIVVELTREANLFSDFVNDGNYESVRICDSTLVETKYVDHSEDYAYDFLSD